MNSVNLGVLIAVLTGVLVGRVFTYPRTGLFPLVGALPGVPTFSLWSKPGGPPREDLAAIPRAARGLLALASAPGGWSPVGDARRPRVRPEELFRLSQSLTDRDWEILATVAKLRLVSGPQIERLHFFDLDNEASRKRVRRRVLKRLSASQALIQLPRRIGGARHGSETQMYALDKAGMELIQDHVEWKSPKRRSLAIPGALFHNHRLAISELYVRLVEFQRASSGAVILRDFSTEPSCWWRFDRDTEYGPNKKNRGYLKPDAYLSAKMSRSDYYTQFWVEVDLGTETVSRVVDKIRRYAAYWLDTHTSRPPNDFMPGIVITTHTERRRDAIRAALDNATIQHGDAYNDRETKLTESVVVTVTLFSDAVRAIVEELPTDTVAQRQAAEEARQRELQAERVRQAEQHERERQEQEAVRARGLWEYRARMANEHAAGNPPAAGSA
jgi:hypothetical protein